MYPKSGFGVSFEVSYFEKLHGVQRPRLNETNINPDDSIKDSGLLEGKDETTSMHSCSLLAKNWRLDDTVVSNLSQVNEFIAAVDNSNSSMMMLNEKSY